MHVLIAGGSGLIGTALRQECQALGWSSKVLTRRPIGPEHGWSWDPARGSVDAAAISWADAVVNLAGAPISQIPWTSSRREAIRNSRLAATASIVDAITANPSPPAVLVNGSAVGIYGDRPGEILTESSPRGGGFLADVVDAWESEASKASAVTRVVMARTGLVLSSQGGVLPLLITTTRWFAGTRFGSGNQIWPWISLRDEARAITRLITDDALHGPINLVAPAADSAATLARAVARSLHRPLPWIAPSRAISLVGGDAGRQLLLADQHVAPEALLSNGFVFTDQDVDACLAALRMSAR